MNKILIVLVLVFGISEPIFAENDRMVPLTELVDINKDTWNLDHKMLDKSVNPKTKAVIFVSLFGSSAGISDVLKFCKKKDLLFLEDSAESFGTFIKNKHSGTIGQGGILSFYGNKI